MSTDCFICQKHRNLSQYSGPVLAEEGGLRLSHFPIIDGAPANRGHLLVEPLRHITDLSEMNEAEATALGKLISIGNKMLKDNSPAEHVYLFRINDKVPHLHFHLLPRYPSTPTEFWGAKLFHWADYPKIALAEIKELSQKLARG